MTDKERFNQRFAKDFNLPINIFNDEQFEYYHELYKDFWPESEWNAVQNEIDRKFGGNIDQWLEHYAKVRDKVITDIYESQEYQDFNKIDMSYYDNETKKYLNGTNLGDRKWYSEDTVGRKFISIDLKKANFQALKHCGVINGFGSYEEFMASYDPSFYFGKSKYTRQVIFGKLNPKRTITVEKWMVARMFNGFYNESVIPTFLMKSRGNVVPFGIKSDELVFEVVKDVPITDEMLTDVEYYANAIFRCSVRCEFYEVEKMPVVNCNGTPIDAYIRRNLISGDEELKCVSAIFFPQVYRLYKGEKITDKDLLFYAEGQVARFIEPLRLDIRLTEEDLKESMKKMSEVNYLVSIKKTDE